MKKTIAYKILVLATLALMSFRGSAQDVESFKDSLRVDGDISLRNVIYNMSGIPDRRVPYSYVINANLNISKGDFSVPLGFTYSEQERSFSQPFNQFGIAPSYKWVKTYLGYNSINWNNYTLGGAQFLGAGVELTPKKFRAGFMYGRFRRATPLDSIGFVTDRNGYPSYERRGWAAKVGLGSEGKFIDLILFKGEDKHDQHSPILKDSITPVFPAENFALGLKANGAIGNIASYFFDAGVSFFNRDKTSPLADSAGFEAPALNFISGLQPPRLSSSVYYGADAGINFNVKGHTIGLSTKYVLPDYQAMGIFFMDNDVFSYGFNHAFSVWQSKINLNYGLNRLNDNLLDKKPVTTIRIQPVVSLSFNPSSVWGVEVNWNNFYTRQEDGRIELADSFRMNQSNPGLTITPHAQWGDTSVFHTAFLMFTQMQLFDNNPYTAEYSQYASTVYGANYSYSILPLNLSFNAGGNYTINENSLIEEKAYGFTVGASKASVDGKWTAGSNASMQLSNISNNISLNLNAGLNLKRKQMLNGSITVLNSSAKAETANDFNELTFMLTYTKNFNYAHKRKE